MKPFLIAISVVVAELSQDISCKSFSLWIFKRILCFH